MADTVLANCRRARNFHRLSAGSSQTHTPQGAIQKQLCVALCVASPYTCVFVKFQFHKVGLGRLCRSRSTSQSYIADLAPGKHLLIFVAEQNLVGMSVDMYVCRVLSSLRAVM